MSRSEYLDGLAAAGFVDPQVMFTHEVAPGMHGAIVRATKPAADDCCGPAEQASCCEPAAKAGCCTGGPGCGCH